MGVAYEGVILFGVVFFFGYGFSAVTQFKGGPGALRSAFQVFMLLVLGAYFVYFWSEGRRTLPMKTLSLALQTTAGLPVGIGRAALRYGLLAGWLLLCLSAAQYLSGWLVLAIVLPWLWVLIDRDHRSLFDVASGTRLAVQAVQAVAGHPNQR
jgi:hypothetical protein